ncbi:hypothetical protein [Streptomyces shenzhenensis]|uniref:Lipoprotein n=1 Tax=Streptomyces shenzhenensis TaxID=943815 RepID=A0A3M0HVY8_9ACTN|nr:hypothetical protein [Streptomyces shenzhenensis]RMB81177.1 hypothetical protein CTZ28_35935 [Streptomyces shenzhenensis]
MTRRPRLLTTAAAGVTAVLLLAGCGGNDDTKQNNKIPGADTAPAKSSSPTSTEPTSPDRPKIELPSDVTYTFDWPKTGDPDKDAVLSDSEQSIKAVDLAIVNQDALDDAYRFYYEGEAAAQTQQFIEAYVKAQARMTGSYRYYNPVVDVSSGSTASLVYCEDQGKAYDLYLKTKKVDKTPITKNSYVLYSSQLKKNDKGVWVVEKLMSQRGSAKCQP